MNLCIIHKVQLTCWRFYDVIAVKLVWGAPRCSCQAAAPAASSNSLNILTGKGRSVRSQPVSHFA
eukprot:6174347-Pleurochrysis_carterae.AAC.1